MTAGPDAELLVIAVEPRARSAGIGTMLVRELERRFAANGVAQYKVSVHAGLVDANRFYERNGFVLARGFRLYDVEWNLYVRSVLHASAERDDH